MEVNVLVQIFEDSLISASDLKYTATNFVHLGIIFLQFVQSKDVNIHKSEALKSRKKIVQQLLSDDQDKYFKQNVV